MYLRESKQRRTDGSVVTYLQLAENVWDAAKGRSQASIVHNCGRADAPEVVERLRRLAKSLLRRCSPKEIVGAGGHWRLICAGSYGDLYVLEAIFHRVADLLNLDVIFYDTTSLHFEIDDEESVDKDGNVHGSQAAGKKSYTAPRPRGHRKNSRGDAPQIVVGMAVTQDGFPVRHWVFPGNTLDVTPVAKVKEDLRGGQRTRCLFVGDAGMVSQANLQALSKGGGKYLLAMPM
jgi:hypothetical protein